MLARSISQAACGLAFFMGFAWDAGASSFAVNPVRVSLPKNASVASLTVRNEGSESTVVQLESVAWSQQAGKDVLAPTQEILATPPIFTIPPGGSQVVRVGLRRARDPQHELTYRLFLQEVPRPPKPDFRGLQVALRLSIPIFVEGAPQRAAIVDWHARRTPQGELRVTAANRGTAHVHVNHLAVRAPGAAQITHTESAYVLHGQTREWALKAGQLPSAGTPLHLSAHTDAGDLEADLVLE
jgi:fimbrial chaperone protein